MAGGPARRPEAPVWQARARSAACGDPLPEGQDPAFGLYLLGTEPPACHLGGPRGFRWPD